MKFSDAYRHMGLFRNQRVPGQLVIQITNRCNAVCPQCGMRVTEPYPRADLGTDDVRRILDAAAEAGIEIVSFTGGEPFLLLKELRTLIKHAGSVGMKHIRTGTNGYLFRGDNGASRRSRIDRLAESLADTPLRNLWISVDSAEPSVHERMRGFPGVIAGIEEALPIFHRHGIYPSANMGINRNMGGASTARIERSSFPSEEAYLDAFRDTYRKAFERFYPFVADLGFTMVSTCYPMSVGEGGPSSGLNPVYAATSEAAPGSLQQVREGRSLPDAPRDPAPIQRPDQGVLATVLPLFPPPAVFLGRRDPVSLQGRNRLLFHRCRLRRYLPLRLQGQ